MSQIIFKRARETMLSEGISKRSWVMRGALTLALFMGLGCESGVKPVEFPALSFSPNPIEMPRPELGASSSELTVTVTNPAWFESVITEVSLVNESAEGLSIVNSAEWSGAVALAPESSREIRLKWTVSGPLELSADLKVLADETEHLIPITTQVPYPEIKLTSNPNGRTTDTGLEVNLYDAAPGDWERAEVYIEGGSGAPLSVSSVCLVDLNGQCIADEASGPFRLCGVEGANPNLCPPVGQLSPLAYGEQHRLSVLFTPPADARRRFEARLVIQSDAATLPEAVVSFRGSPCLRSAPGEACAPVYSIEGATLTQGRQTMESEQFKTQGVLSTGAHTSRDAKSGLYLSGSLQP